MALAIDDQPTKSVNILALAGFVGGTLAVGALGGYATSAGLDGWYASLARPPLTPSDHIFGPVWTALYVMMAVSAWLVWTREVGLVRRQIMAIYGAQLALNFGWSILFFYLRSPLFALSEILVLIFVVLAMTRFFWWRNPYAGALLVPYVLWLAFAAYLNAGFWLMNTPVT